MYNSAACLVHLRPLYGKVHKYISDRWGSQDKNQEHQAPEYGNGMITIGSRIPNRWWIDIDRDDSSTSRIMKIDGGLELTKPQSAAIARDQSLLRNIQVERTFGIISTLAVDETKNHGHGIIPDHRFEGLCNF